MTNSKKAKKKDAPISSLDKAFGIAASFPSMRPSEFRQTLAEFKQRSKKLRRNLGLTEDIANPPVANPDNKYYFDFLSASKNQLQYTAAVRDIILDAWYQKKQVYIVNQETLDYISDVFRIQDLYIPLNVILEEACREPIYLQFDGISTLTGAFCGITRFVNDGMNIQKTPLIEPVFCCVLLEEPNPHVFFHYHEMMMISEFFLDANMSDNIRKVMLSLAYISYMRRMQDAPGNVFIEIPRRDANCWEIRKSPFPESVIDFVDPIGWSAAGLAPLLGFLSRKNLLEALEKNSVGEQRLHPGYYSETEDCYGPKTFRMAFDWESSRTIYQYDSNTEQTFRDKYLEEILLKGFSQELLWYMPQDAILLFHKDTYQVTLVSIGILADSEKNGIYLLNVTESKAPLYVIPASFELSSFLTDENLSGIICALYHILSVYRDKTIKKAQKDILSSGNPNEKQMVPTYEPNHRNLRHQDEDTDPFRRGEDIRYIPMPELFDLTKRTVKRTPRTEKVSGGWRVIPHTRRPHPHRYWVGSGENRHMEVRYLQRMRIHPDEKPSKTTLKNLV